MVDLRPRLLKQWHSASTIRRTQAKVGNGTVMQHQFHVVIERDENGFYIASVPQLRGCHTQTQNLDDLNERVREAITVLPAP